MSVLYRGKIAGQSLGGSPDQPSPFQTTTRQNGRESRSGNGYVLPNGVPFQVIDYSVVPKILDKRTVFSTPWCYLVAKTAEPSLEPYYALSSADYVSTLALTTEEEILFVRQFRPAVERLTLELPGGHVDDGETPELAARRELLEETGYEAGRIELLGTLNPDAGRLTNRLWCYFAPSLKRAHAELPSEAGVEVIRCPREEVFGMITRAGIDQAQTLAILMLGVVAYGQELFFPNGAPSFHSRSL